MYAYVLLNLKEANEQDVLEDFLDMSEVKDGHILFGEWDIILKIQMESPEGITSFVIDKVRNHEGVKLTSTLIVAK